MQPDETQCPACDEEMPRARIKLGYILCVKCSTEQRKRMLVACIGKSGYQAITKEELKQLDPKRRNDAT